MSIVDTLQKLNIQSNALQRGIHPDYVVIERAELELLLKAYAQQSTELFAQRVEEVDTIGAAFTEQDKHMPETHEFKMDGRESR